MAYDQKKIYEQAKEAITKNNLFSIKDIIAFIPCETDSFYRFFPTKTSDLILIIFADKIIIQLFSQFNISSICRLILLITVEGNFNLIVKSGL